MKFLPVTLLCQPMLPLFMFCLGDNIVEISLVQCSCPIRTHITARVEVFLLVFLHNLLARPPHCSLSLRYRGLCVDVSVGVGQPVISCSLCFDQVQFSVIVAVITQRRSLTGPDLVEEVERVQPLLWWLFPTSVKFWWPEWKRHHALGYFWDKHDHVGFLNKCGRWGGLWTRKAVEYGNQSLTGHPSRTLRVSSAENSLEAQLKRLQREARTLTTTELEATPVIFWQGIWLPSAFVLRAFLRLNLKEWTK